MSDNADRNVVLERRSPGGKLLGTRTVQLVDLTRIYATVAFGGLGGRYRFKLATGTSKLTLHGWRLRREDCERLLDLCGRMPKGDPS